MESHQSFEKNDVSRIGVSGIGKSFMFDKGVLWDGDSLIAFFHLFESFIGQIEIKRVGMIEIVLGSINVLSKT